MEAPNPWAKAFASLNQVDNAAINNNVQAQAPPPAYHNPNQYNNIYNSYFPCTNQWGSNSPPGQPVYNPPPPPAIVLPSQNSQPYGQPYNYTPTYAQMANYQGRDYQQTQHQQHHQSSPAASQNGPGQLHSVSKAGTPRFGGPVSFKIPKKSQQQPAQKQNTVPRPPVTQKSQPMSIPTPPPPPNMAQNNSMSRPMNEQYKPIFNSTQQQQFHNHTLNGSVQNKNDSKNTNNNNNNNSNGTSQAHKFTPELHDYCNRAYQLAKTDLERDRMEIILKGKITKVFNENKVVDWLREPLPTLSSSAALSATPPKLPQAAKPNYGAVPNQVNSIKKRLEYDNDKKNGSKSSEPSKKDFDDKNGYGKKRYSDSDEDDYIPLSGSSKKRRPDESRADVSPKMSKRAKKRAAKIQREQAKSTKGVVFSEAKQAERRARFLDYNSRHSTAETGSRILNRITFNTFQDTGGDGDFNLDEVEPIVGTCQKLEKRYLRLTSAPDPSTVRPIDVLRRALDMVKTKWATDKDYSYACDQLKSIRQDVVVQVIQCEFAVLAYETAARIAIEGNDYAEFSSCVSKLAELYVMPTLVGKCRNRREFLSYQILFYISNSNEGGLQKLLKTLSIEDRSDELVAFALKVSTAIALSNYHGIFLLYSHAPAHCGLVMDWFIERERSKALQAVLKAFRPKIKTDWLKEELAFESHLEFEKFIAKFNIIYMNNGSQTQNDEIDCKESHFAVQRQKAAEAVAAAQTQL